jgi:glyoxylase-like metal-dependent hydrolase (beta-lactamase superfamily II)
MRSDAGSLTYLPRGCEQYLEGESPRVFGKQAMVRFLPMYSQQPFSFAALREFAADARRIGFGDGKPFRFPYPPDGFLAEGGELPGAPGWEVIEAPGHTDDALCFYHRDSATLLSGDAVVTLDGKAWFNPEWVDAKTSAATEARLRALDVRHLLPGHGKPISGDVWATAMSFTTQPPARGVLARCARAFGGW